MTTYQDVFTGSNIYPSEISYSQITLAADITLDWPQETSSYTDLATRIIDVVAVLAGLVITLPDATKAGTGQTVLFNNLSAETFVVADADGTQVVSLASGTIWQIYLTDNTTAAGSWQILQFGAGISNANASALAGYGLKAIGTTLAQASPVTTLNTDYTPLGPDRAGLLVWTGATGTITLPSPADVGNGWFIQVNNSGSGAVALVAANGALIDGSGAFSFQPGESATITTDGLAYYSMGFGKDAVFAFDYTSIPVAGGGDYTLSGSELNRIAYNFTGLLTADRTIIVPATVQQYWISNSTTGLFNFTIKTAVGTGQTLASGQRAIFYCDGVNVVDADSSTASFPIGIAQGGTGSTTASGARINLGGTSIGIALFTAADQDAAWAAMGPVALVSGGAF